MYARQSVRLMELDEDDMMLGSMVGEEEQSARSDEEELEWQQVHQVEFMEWLPTLVMSVSAIWLSS